MRTVLFDENMPKLLRLELPEFRVTTVQEEGLAGLTNGMLLRQAEGRFDILVTADKRLQHQQNLSTFRIAVVVAAAESTRLRHMKAIVPNLPAAISNATPGSITIVRG